MTESASATFDTAVRLHVYRHFLDAGRPPGPAETARDLGEDPRAVEAAYLRLAEAHHLVLEPGTTRVCMAMPLSAEPTAFRVETPRGAYWANCAWDAFGIPAMLGSDARILTSCACCRDPWALEVKDGALASGDAGVLHVLVPPSRWWDDIAFT